MEAGNEDFKALCPEFRETVVKAHRATSGHDDRGHRLQEGDQCVVDRKEAHKWFFKENPVQDGIGATTHPRSCCPARQGHGRARRDRDDPRGHAGSEHACGCLALWFVTRTRASPVPCEHALLVQALQEGDLPQLLQGHKNACDEHLGVRGAREWTIGRRRG